MQNRILDKNTTISAVGLGCMGLSHAFGIPLEKEEDADNGLPSGDNSSFYRGKP